MTNLKAILVGGFLGILGTLGGVKLAHAECSQDAYNTPGFENDSPDHQGLYSNRSDALQASELCEVDGGAYEAPSGEWVSYCNSSFELDACEELSNLIDCSAMSAEACDLAMGDVFEGCLAVYGITGAQ